MTAIKRRSFLAQSAMGVVGATFAAGTSRAVGANERIRIAVLGAGNQGRGHAESLMSLKEAEIAYVSDIDQERLAQQVKLSGAKGVADFRRILDDPSVDAVTIALPDHWHAPAALLAMEAGKHVYVEKPCSHNVVEGRLMVEAARRHKRVVAHGTHSRSTPGIREAMQLLHEGVIGDVFIAKCWNWQLRENIGHASPSPPPAHVDYESWVGPAEWMPFQENRFHYKWHWWYNFGTGDLGNDGIHEFDLAIWGLGVDAHPQIVSAAGGKYFFDDDQQFPDTAQVALEWPGDGKPRSRKMLIYEQRLWSTTYPFNVDSGVEFFGDKGRMFLSKRGKFEIRGERNAPIQKELEGRMDAKLQDNQGNWISCIKSGDTPNASIEIGHRTATAAHLGNIAVRLERSLRFDPKSEQIVNDSEASTFLSRKYRADGHWAIPESA